MPQQLHLEEPPKEDSPDLTDAEIASSVKTSNVEDFIRSIEENLRSLVCSNIGGIIKSHDLRRRGDHLYCRTKILFEDEPEKVLIFQVDWLGT